MLNFPLAAAVLALLTAFLHVLSTALTMGRVMPRRLKKGCPDRPPVSLIRPLRGLDPLDPLTLKSGFELGYPRYELILCCAEESDPAAALARALISANPHADARLLIGESNATANPKLNNLIKGWRAARHEWIAIADCNVLMPKDYIERLLATWQEDTGLVCAPPIGACAEGFAAELECAFLNTYQARWQYAADTIGLGFAQGKSMLLPRPVLDEAGGIAALASEIAEDAAATKVVRSRGLRVRLVDCPFAQPLGRRSFAEVWNRQLRWARLRRATFPLFFVPEILSSSLVTIAAAAIGAEAVGAAPLGAVAIAAVLWFGCEALLAYAAGWQLTLRSPLAWLVRDLALPVLWVQAWLGRGFTWRGHTMRAAGAAAGKSA